MGTAQRQQRLWGRGALLAATGVALLVGLLDLPAASAEPEAPLVGRPFAPVVEGVVQGDLILAGNSNLLSAGGWRSDTVSAADVDGDRTRICARRLPTGRLACADNSSSADLDLPAGARVIAARLYVETSVGANLAPLRVAVDGPGDGFAYRTLPASVATPVPGTPAKLYEAIGGIGDGAVLRQAVWDLTGYIASSGPGTYTVADIVNERVGPWLPYASWAIVAAYELDPAARPGVADDGSRFADRYISWHDGFQHLDGGSLDVPIGGVDGGPATFGKSFHVVGRGRGGRSDNLLFANGPLGNNNAPDDSPPPPGVRLGTDPACNTVTDVQNDSICVLGTPVGAKSPGATAFRSTADGETPSSGSGVDIDVIRIPDRFLRAADGGAVLQVRATGGDTLAPGMIAVSIDVQRGGP